MPSGLPEVILYPIMHAYEFLLSSLKDLWIPKISLSRLLTVQKVS